MSPGWGSRGAVLRGTVQAGEHWQQSDAGASHAWVAAQRPARLLEGRHQTGRGEPALDHDRNERPDPDQLLPDVPLAVFVQNRKSYANSSGKADRRPVRLPSRSFRLEADHRLVDGPQGGSSLPGQIQPDHVQQRPATLRGRLHA
uniref:(northern house mosquito) hypothetical protein n=1 Tax=Culex pipiens TaxID=7175 RepID=A0A8D8AGT6_CULPI